MSEVEAEQRESMEFNVLIVGGGPAGLAAAGLFGSLELVAVRLAGHAPQTLARVRKATLTLLWRLGLSRSKASNTSPNTASRHRHRQRQENRMTLVPALPQRGSSPIH